MVYMSKNKTRKTKKRGRKTKKKTGGATCRRNRDNCYDCTNFRDPRRRNKRCVYNLDTGDCRQKNTVAGRYHGRNDWTEGPCHRPLPTVPPNEVIQVANDSPILQRQFSDGGTPQAIPVLPGDQTSDYYRLDYDDIREVEDRRESICTRAMESAGECVISGGKRKKRKKTKRRKRKMRKKTRRKRGRGNTFKRAAAATAVGALAMSNPVGAFKTKLPSRTEFNDAKFQLGKVCSTSREGKKLMRNLGLKFHPDKYAVALKPQATKYFQELTEVFGNGSCGRKSTSSNRKPNSSNRNSRGRKNKPKPKRKSGESAKKARTRQKAENNTIRNIVAGLGITVTTGIIGLVRKASRAYRIGYMHTNHNDNYIYIDIDGNKKRVGTKDFVLYVSGLLVNKDLRDHIEDNIDMGEWIIDQSDRGL